MIAISVNGGSSSLKLGIFDIDKQEFIGSAVSEKVTYEDSFIKFKYGDFKDTVKVYLKDHESAFLFSLKMILQNTSGLMEDISLVVHRVVHGGEKYNKPVLIDEEVVNDIEALSDFAPLHNPVNLQVINAAKKKLDNVPHYAVFDTAFHHTVSLENSLYAIPYEYYEKYKVRKYGFHGTSHEYLMHETAKVLNIKESGLNIVTAHIGNGASLCAIQNGVSINTSMGFSPLVGVPMGTRSGDIDPTVIDYLMRKENIEFDVVMRMLNNESGLLGVSEVSNDLRDIYDAIEDGDNNSKLAREIQVKRVTDYIAIYINELVDVDAIVFTAGVGENDSKFRKDVCNKLRSFNISIDEKKNQNGDIDITGSNSNIKVLVIPTNEEFMMVKKVLDSTIVSNYE